MTTSDVTKVAQLTKRIRNKQDDIAELSRQRDAAVIAAVDAGATYKVLADKAGVTQPAIAKILKRAQAEQNA